MLDRAHIEKLLKLNGVEPTAPDEEIKSVLVGARWHKNDVETALMVLRENKDSHETHVDTLHKVFSSDDQLKPQTISALLGIEVTVAKDSLEINRKKMTPTVTFGQMVQIFFVSASASLICILASMWYMQMGIFHITMR
jgi:hypothetical protein